MLVSLDLMKEPFDKYSYALCSAWHEDRKQWKTAALSKVQLLNSGIKALCLVFYSEQTKQAAV